MKKTVILAAVLGLAACGKPAEDAQSQAANIVTDSETTAGTPSGSGAPDAWNQCAVCHKAEAGAPNGLGPNLHGIVGRAAGSVAGFTYSPAMQKSGLTWDEATLDAFLTKPQAKLPGTRMAYAGQPDAAKRKALIDWLAAQK